MSPPGTDPPVRDLTLPVPGHTLHGIAADPPPGVPTVARVSVLSGYGDHAGRYAHALQWLAARGVAAAALSFRGHGRSTGKVAHCRRWDDYLADATAFLADPATERNPPCVHGGRKGPPGLPHPSDGRTPHFAPGEHAGGSVGPPRPPHFLLGHSHGGLVATALAQRDQLPDLAGVILCAPYFALALPVPRGRRLLAAALARLYPSLPLRSSVTPAMLSRDELMSAPDPLCPGVATPGWFAAATAAQRDVTAAAAAFRPPLLMLVPGDDPVADASAAERFFARCGSPDKTIRRYPEARHELLRDLCREAVLDDVLGWVMAHVR